MLLLGVLVAAGVWAFGRLQVLVLSLVIGFAQVAVLAPAVRRLTASGVPRPLAAVVSVLLLAGGFGTLLLLALRELVGSLTTLPSLLDRAFSRVEAALDDGALALDPAVLARFFDQVQSLLQTVFGALTTGVVSGASFLASLSAVLGVGLLFAVFALADGDRVWTGVVRLFAPGRQPAVRAAGDEALRVTGAWFYASTLTGLVDALGIGLGLWLIGVPLVAPLMVLTFVLGYVPMVGATVAGAIAVVVALASGGLGDGAATLVVVLLVQQLESNVLAPLLLSRAVSFPPLVTLLVTTTAAVLLGAVGMFLAVPIAGAVVAAVRRYRTEPTAAPPPTALRPTELPAS